MIGFELRSLRAPGLLGLPAGALGGLDHVLTVNGRGGAPIVEQVGRGRGDDRQVLEVLLEEVVHEDGRAVEVIDGYVEEPLDLGRIRFQRAGATEPSRRIGKEAGIPLVATNDIHYIEEGDAPAHEVHMCIGMGKSLSDPNRLKQDMQASDADLEHVFLKLTQNA